MCHRRSGKLNRQNMKTYAIWDSINKSHVCTPHGSMLTFVEEYDAHKVIQDMYDRGEYSDYPSNVLKIDVYENRDFTTQIEFSPVDAVEPNQPAGDE